MGSNELAVRFTENKYATKNEVARELRTSLVDTFWQNILAYRSNFNHYLSIKSIDKNMYVYCECESVNKLMQSIENKLTRINDEFSKICIKPNDIKFFQDKCLIKSLKAVANKNDLDVTESYLRSLLSGDLKEVAASHKVLVNYLNAEKYITRKFSNPIDDNFLADVFQNFHNIEEITSFYRNREDTNRENKVIIDRIYTCAPIHLIDGMMNSLFVFAQNSEINAVAKMLIANFYMNYIRPFNSYSDEFSLLYSKALLAHDSYGEIITYLPLESIMRNTEDVGKLYSDVQKTNDVTYFVIYMGKLLDKTLDDVLDDLANLSAEILKSDYYQEDEEKEESVPEIITYIQEEPIKESEPTIEPIQEEITTYEEPKIEEPLETVIKEEQTPIEEPKKVVEEVKVEDKPIEVKYVKQELAVSYIPPALDEKEAYRLEQHLREMDPALKKGEAKFYARHCVIGKKYTIAQFKKSIGCAYETARTSMDHLAELGYYRKEQIKNKFVYSPIPR